MEGRGEYESHDVEIGPDGLRDLMRQIEFVRERVNEMAEMRAEQRANEVRERIAREGFRIETLQAVVNTLAETGFEAFNIEELNHILEVIDWLILEWDPTFKGFLQAVQQKLTGA